MYLTLSSTSPVLPISDTNQSSLNEDGLMHGNSKKRYICIVKENLVFRFQVKHPTKYFLQFTIYCDKSL